MGHVMSVGHQYRYSGRKAVHRVVVRSRHWLKRERRGKSRKEVVDDGVESGCHERAGP